MKTRAQTSTLTIRIRTADGVYRYMPVCKAPNGKIKSLTAMVNGQSEYHPEGRYHLRYRSKGKRVWESVGTDPVDAQIAQRRRNHTLVGEALGLKVVPLAIVPPPALELTSPAIECAVSEYLDGIKLRRSKRTFAAYNHCLSQFVRICPKTYLPRSPVPM